MHVVEISVLEQRYQAVMAVVQDGWKATEVAGRLGVSRRAIHNWIARYEAGDHGASCISSASSASIPFPVARASIAVSSATTSSSCVGARRGVTSSVAGSAIGRCSCCS